jgi:hypothetical protein
MPELNQLIGVGFCKGYQDGDYRVSAAVGDLSKKRLDELKLAMLSAISAADDMWRRAQDTTDPKQGDTDAGRAALAQSEVDETDDIVEWLGETLDELMPPAREPTAEQAEALKPENNRLRSISVSPPEDFRVAQSEGKIVTPDEALGRHQGTGEKP